LATASFALSSVILLAASLSMFSLHKHFDAILSSSCSFLLQEQACQEERLLVNFKL
jgi:hypothetical protein